MKDKTQTLADVRANLDRFEKQLTGVILPLWLEKGWDEKYGGFPERLGPNGEHQDLGYKRLTATTRQLFVFSEWSQRWNQAACAQMAHRIYEYLMSRYWNRTSEGWATKVSTEGKPSDLNHDLYSTAFVIFALSHYGKVFGKPEAIATARQTMMTIDERMRHPFGGYVTQTDMNWKPLTQDLDQNPHMHLLEALQVLNAAAPNEATIGFEDKIAGLMAQSLYDEKLGLLREFFDVQAKPRADKGQWVEAGHQFEWYWLIRGGSKRAYNQTYAPVVDRMFDWGAAHGIDKARGGVYDINDTTGAVIQATKRIWPTTESIRAIACRWNLEKKEEHLRLLDEQLQMFVKSYLSPKGWNEALNEDLKPNRSDMPVTTSYHLTTACLDSIAMVGR